MLVHKTTCGAVVKRLALNAILKLNIEKASDETPRAKKLNLLQIRDEAFGKAEQSHDRIRFRISSIPKRRLYTNRGSERVGVASAQVDESLMPEISTGCIRLIPAFREQQSEIRLESDKKSTRRIRPDCLSRTVSNWDKMYEEVYDEGMAMRAATYRNLTVGNAIDKIKYDIKRTISLCSEGVNPTSFAPDPMCKPNQTFSDGRYVCQKNFHDVNYIKTHYPDASLETKRYNFDTSIFKSYTTSRTQGRRNMDADEKSQKTAESELKKQTALF